MVMKVEVPLHSHVSTSLAFFSMYTNMTTLLLPVQHSYKPKQIKLGLLLSNSIGRDLMGINLHESSKNEVPCCKQGVPQWGRLFGEDHLRATAQAADVARKGTGSGSRFMRI